MMHITTLRTYFGTTLTSLLFIQACSAGHHAEVEQGLTLQALRVDTGEAVWPVKWILKGNDETYDLLEDSATLNLSQMQAYELRAGDYTATAYSGDFAGSVNFTLPHDKSVIYVDLYPDVPPISVEIITPLEPNKPFKVSWVGPGESDDQIVIVPSGADYWQMFESAKVSEGNPLTLIAPDNQANYDLLYLSKAKWVMKVEARIPFSIKK